MASSEPLLSDGIFNKIRCLTDLIPLNKRARRITAAGGLLFLVILALLYAQSSVRRSLFALEAKK